MPQSNLNARLDTRAKGVESTIDSRDFLEGLSMDIQTMHLDQRHITLTVQAEPHRILVDHAKPLGLVLNELIVNALKYAFPDGRTETVIVAFHCLKVECTLTVQDDGVGFDPSLLAQGSGLGRRMVKALMDQIGGSVRSDRARTAARTASYGGQRFKSGVRTAHKKYHH